MIRFVKFVTGFFLLFLLVYFFENNVNITALIENISLANIAILILLSVAMSFLLAAQLYTLFNIFPPSINFKESCHLVFNNSLINALLPLKAGLLYRWLYVNKMFAYPLKRYLTNTVTGQLVQFSSSIFLAACVFFYYANNINLTISPSITFIVLAISFGLLITLLITKKFHAELIYLFDNAKKNKSKILILLATQFSFLFVASLRLYLTAEFMNIDVKLIDIILVNTLLTIILFTNFTIGNLGLKEGGIVLIAAQLGLPSEQLLFAAILDRMISLIPLITIGSYSTYWLRSRISNL